MLSVQQEENRVSSEKGEEVLKLKLQAYTSLLRDRQAQARCSRYPRKRVLAQPGPGGIDAWNRREEVKAEGDTSTPLPRVGGGPGGSGGSLGGSRRHALNVAVQMYTCGPGRVQRAGKRAEAAQVFL